jgi:hypothetical protein
MINLQKTAYRFLVLIIIALAVSPAFALGEGNRNLLLIGVMVLSPVLIITFNKFHKSDIWILSFLISIIAIPLLHQPQSMRWSTVLYSCMFGLTFMAYTRLLSKSKLSPFNYLNILKLLIIAYAITLLIQQISVLLGIPIFNISNYDEATPFKLNSLAAEPSHSARIMALMMYSFITIKELLLSRTYNLKKDLHNDKWVWIAFVWSMLTMGSGTAFLFLPLVLLKFLKRKNIIPLILLSFGVFGVLVVLGVDVFERTYKVFLATLTLDNNAILRADHSAAMRIVPFLVLMPMLSITTMNGWFGHGIDNVSTFLSDYIYGLPEGTSGGGLIQLWMDYGLIVFLIYVLTTLNIIYIKKDLFSLFFWFLLVFMYSINNQIVWLCIILLFTNNYFYKKLSLINQN